MYYGEQTKDEERLFALLDEMLSEADKKAIVEAEDLFEFRGIVRALLSDTANVGDETQ